MYKSDSHTGARIVLLCLLFGAFALRLYALTLQDIWWDEARNIDVALRPLVQVATAPELDIHPPVYFWMLHVWSRFAGVSRALEAEQIAYLMRFMSVAAGVIGVALLFPFTKKISNRAAGLLAVGLGAFSPFWLAESQETRMYTLGFALLLAAAYCFLRSLGKTSVDNISPEATPARWPSLSLFVILSALALLTHYNAVFILVAWYIWWLGYAVMQERLARKREVATLLLAGSAMTLLVLPITPIALQQIPGYENPNLTVPTIADYLWQNWQAYIGGYAFNSEMLRGFGSQWLWVVLIVTMLGLVIHVYSSRRVKDEVSAVGFSFMIFWLAAGLALYYVAVLDRGAFNVRYSSFITPALYAGCAVAILAWQYWSRLLPALGVGLLLVGFVPAIQADLFDERFAREDIAGVTEWLRANTGPDDLILVDQKYPFGFYYDRYAIEPQSDIPGDEVAPARYMFVDINTVDTVLNQWAAEADTIFWLQWYESDTDPRRAVSFLLDKYGSRQGEEWFQGYSIDWWQMDPPTKFVLAEDMMPSDHQFGQAVESTEASIPTASLRPGGGVPVVIRWQRLPGGVVDRPLKARLAIYNDDDARIAQVDKRILNDRHLHASEWSVDDRPLNVYLIDLPEDLASGTYEVRLLVYDADSLEPLPFIDEAGNPAGLEADLGQIVVTEE